MSRPCQDCHLFEHSNESFIMDPFLETILMSSAFRAATGQGKGTHIYRGRHLGETEPTYAAAKLEFRSAFRDRIKRECQNYRADGMDEVKWLDLIEGVRSDLSVDHGEILESKTLRLGTVQKMLSLALKLYWKAGDPGKQPFWPPLDRQVIIAARKGLGKGDRDISWKKLKDREQYIRMMRAIDAFARAAGHAGACEWEYGVWQTNDDL
jgi:hypothetical protein